MRILLVEDERELSNALVAILTRSNYSVDPVYDGEDALYYLETENYDAVILDIMIPKIDGIEVLKTIRKEGNKIPVIMLTAKSEIDDRVVGLDSGADDYLTKPFASKELLARLRALTRRGEQLTENIVKVGNISLNRSSFELFSDSGSFRLANKEYQMIEMLMVNQNQLIPTEKFMERIWGYDSEAEINVVWVHISFLRKKLQQLKANIQIKANRNMGYSLEMIN
ncbi:response regulator receiver domain protein [[Eubacterium] yurii subsp. margaretiae ATCC 43715]|nr:response regulator receiver domain protein [[Eubacterium] yurii subsp. margaretiae ATCC 43715]SKC49750.1 DNA-binding response regulator, OmpR family, contains REC and winged-helix (wHTH) domain [[Eubacterium] yurii]